MNEFKTPKISVVVTTYNRKELLKETIVSILNQTFTDFELIVVDNNSNYDFLSHIKSFNDDRIRSFKNQNNGIIAVNRNFGIKQSRGEFIAFCDDDDLWFKEKLEKQFDAVRKTPDIGLCFTKVEYINAFGQSLLRGFDLKKYHKRLSLNSFIISMGFVTTSSILINKSVVDNVGVFNEDQCLIAFEDYEFISRILSRYKMIYVNIPLVKYRVSGNNNSKLDSRNTWYHKSIYCNNLIKENLKVNSFVYTIKLIKIITLYISLSVKSCFISRK
jgi:teichuronic acid biosynthesis glycosyltransferase TuaG